MHITIEQGPIKDKLGNTVAIAKKTFVLGLHGPQTYLKRHITKPDGTEFAEDRKNLPRNLIAAIRDMLEASEG